MLCLGEAGFWAKKNRFHTISSKFIFLFRKTRQTFFPLQICPHFFCGALFSHPQSRGFDHCLKIKAYPFKPAVRTVEEGAPPSKCSIPPCLAPPGSILPPAGRAGQKLETTETSWVSCGGWVPPGFHTHTYIYIYNISMYIYTHIHR